MKMRYYIEVIWYVSKLSNCWSFLKGRNEEAFQALRRCLHSLQCLLHPKFSPFTIDRLSNKPQVQIGSSNSLFKLFSCISGTFILITSMYSLPVFSLFVYFYFFSFHWQVAMDSSRSHCALFFSVLFLYAHLLGHFGCHTTALEVTIL